MNYRCLVLGHKWKRLTHWRAVEPDRGEFAFPEAEILALGECERCGKREPRRCHGTFTWNRSDQYTMAEAMKSWEGEIEGFRAP
jgi:hypothetical protein